MERVQRTWTTNSLSPNNSIFFRWLITVSGFAVSGSRATSVDRLLPLLLVSVFTRWKSARGSSLEICNLTDTIFAKLVEFLNKNRLPVEFNQFHKRLLGGSCGEYLQFRFITMKLSLNKWVKINCLYSMTVYDVWFIDHTAYSLTSKCICIQYVLDNKMKQKATHFSNIINRPFACFIYASGNEKSPRSAHNAKRDSVHTQAFYTWFFFTK